MKTFQIRRWSEDYGWQDSVVKDTLGEAISSVRYQYDQYVNGGDDVTFEIIQVEKKLVFEFPCPHPELDHGICLSCGEDRDPNSNRFGKTVHE